MKPKQISIACGAAFAALAGSAFAGPAINPEITVNISGASALSLTLGRAMLDICDTSSPATTMFVFYNNAGGTGHKAYYCTLKNPVDAANPNPNIDGKRVLVFKRDAGGSVQGVIPVSRSQAIARMDIASGCGAETTIALQTGGGVTVTGIPFKTCPNTVNAVPDAGVSDVEPTMFVGINKASPADPDFGTDPADGNLVVSSLFANIFNTPVSDKLYRELQVAQGKYASIAAANAGDPAFAEANAPSLTRSQVTSLMTGTVKDWSSLFPAIDGTHAGGVTSTTVKVCRRVNGSGTQATANMYFESFPCATAPGIAGFLEPATNLTDDNGGNDANGGLLLATGGQYTVTMNSGAGNVDECLTDANNRSEGAIGVMGTERIPGTTPADDGDGVADGWHYIKLDGVYPSVKNAIDGAYTMVVESTIQWRNSGLSTAQTDLLTTIRNLSGNPDIIAFVPLFGIAALPTNGYTYDGIAPTTRGTRFSNSCQPIQLF